MYKWQQAYIDDIKSCNTNSPDREARMLKDYEEKGFCEIELWCMADAVAKFVLPRLKEFRDKVVKRDTNDNYPPVKSFDAMIYSFQKIIDNDHLYVQLEERMKIKKGLQLFAKHLIGMWC
jgi:hypothetical protein